MCRSTESTAWKVKVMSLNGKRVVVGIGFCVCLLSAANYYLDLGAFGRFGKPVMLISLLVILLFQRFVGPSFSEIQEYRDKKRAQPPPPNS